MKISILQWNVWRHEKADSVLQLLSSINADILCLQELTADSAINPRRNLPKEISAYEYHVSYAPTVTRPNDRMGNGIFSKFPITAKREAYVQHENINNPRGLEENRMYIEVDLAIDDKRLSVGTTHLSYSPSFAPSAGKDAEAIRLLSVLESHQSGFVFTGDLNYPSSAPMIKTFSERMAPAGPDYSQATWPSRSVSFPDFSVDPLTYRLDYVFTTADVRVLESKILRTTVSDHLPILVTIEL
jgi:endonuclease/exonuclease/phosphatase family metal-dependent hydrolase